MAYRRLRQSKSLPGPPNVTLLHEGIEDYEQIEIESLLMKFLHDLK